MTPVLHNEYCPTRECKANLKSVLSTDFMTHREGRTETSHTQGSYRGVLFLFCRTFFSNSDV